MNGYREVALERIAEILKQYNIVDRRDIAKLDPGVRKLLKMNLGDNGPFEKWGQPWKIWKGELKILFAWDQMKPEDKK